MKDLHSHILYGIDDGSSSIEKSIAILKDAIEEGVTDIILTPHYIENSQYSANNKEKLGLLKKIQKELTDNKMDINLYIGNEVYINDNILELIKKKKVATLNNSRYVLVELPMAKMYINTKQIFFELARNGYIAVVAHPERYRYLQDNMELVDELLEMGVLFQGNYRSLFGYYGKDAKKALKNLIKTHRISFLGSDIHKTDGFNIKKLEKKVYKLTKSMDETKKLLEENFDCVIEDKEIKIN